MSTESKSKDLLLEDYRYCAEGLAKNEQSGETRVNLFTSLITLVGGGIALLATKEENPLEGAELQFIILVYLVLMLIFGIIMLIRMIGRNKKTDLAFHRLDVIRQTFKDIAINEENLFYYNLYKNVDNQRFQSDPVNQSKRLPSREKIGGLASITAYINSVLIVGIVIDILFPLETPVQGIHYYRIIALGLLALIVSFVLQLYFIISIEKRRKNKKPDGMPTHAGGVVFMKDDNNVNHYLIQRTKDSGEEWDLPKGHIKDSDTGHAETALLKVQEECGVFGQAICLLDRLQFNSTYNNKGKENQKRVDDKFYLINCIHKVELQSDKLKWLPFEEARKKLTYEESKYLVTLAESKIRK